MGQARKAHAEKQRTVEKYKKRAITGALIAGLGAVTFAGYNQLSDTPVKANAIKQPISPEFRQTMPKDLQDLLRGVRTTQAPVERLIDLPNRELTTFSLKGGRTVRVVQAGGELSTGPMTDQQLAALEKHYTLFNDFSTSKARIVAPVFEGDPSGSVISLREAKMVAEPINKDVVLFIVPERVDIGTFQYNHQPYPNTVTFTNKSIVASFIRPDYPGGAEGVIVEPCQGMVNMVLSNKADFKDADKSQQEGITQLGQENICNGIAKAIYANELGVSFSEYVDVRSSKPIVGGSNQPSENENAFYSSMPYINSEAVYSSIGDNIPTDIGDYLSYPSVTE